MGPKKSLSETIEDYALVRIPEGERKDWFSLFIVFVGFATVMFFFLIGGLTTTVGGFVWGMIACFIAATAAFVFAMLIAPIALREGLSCDLISRAFGFGKRGSVLPSLVYAASLIFFLAVESTIIAGPIAYMLKVDPNSIGMKLPTYVILFAIWAALTMFGFNQVSRVALIAVPVLFVFLLYEFVFVLAPAGSLAATFSNPGLPGLPLDKGGLPQDIGFYIGLNVALGTAPLLGLFTADYARYGRQVRDLWPMAFAGSYLAYFFVPIVGAMVVFVGFPQVFAFFKSIGLPDAAAGQAAAASPGMTFAILGGWAGVLLVFVSQVKVQTLNSYGSSLAITNVLMMGANWRPGRGWAVLFACAIGAFAAVTLDVLGLMAQMLTYLTIFAGAWATIICTDYYIVRGWLGLGERRIANLDSLPDFNWAGIASYVIAFAIPSYLFSIGALLVPAVLALPLALVAHTALSLATQGRFQREQQTAHFTEHAA